VKDTPYTLLKIGNEIVREPLDSDIKIERVFHANGILLSDWETAEKVAFSCDPNSGDTVKVPYFKHPAFNPSTLPKRAERLTLEQAKQILNIT